MSWQIFIRSKFATWALAGVLVFVCFIAVRILLQKHEIDAQIAKLQTQADNIRKNNLQLSGLVSYFNTPQYEEKQARQQLNLKKDGEFVVVLPADSGEVSGQQTTAAPKSNPKKWFDYFFGKP